MMRAASQMLSMLSDQEKDLSFILLHTPPKVKKKGGLAILEQTSQIRQVLPPDQIEHQRIMSQYGMVEDSPGRWFKKRGESAQCGNGLFGSGDFKDTPF